MHFHRQIHSLQNLFCSNTAYSEHAFIHGFRTLGRRTDTDSRKIEIATFFGYGPNMRNHAERMQLLVVVIMKSQGLTLDYTAVKPKTALFYELPATGMA